MGRKKKNTKEELKFSKFEIVYEDGFEKEWAKVLAGFMLQQIKKDIDSQGEG